MAARAVDLSADFRFADAAAYAAVYGHPHGAPERLAAFACALPEHAGGGRRRRARRPPGLLHHLGAAGGGAAPELGLVEPRVSVVAVTGSTGAGRTPTATTHHPARRSNLFAYNPLAHRHEPEMRALAAAASGVEAEIYFVPHAGPFARGIYATVQARLARAAGRDRGARGAGRFLSGAPFVDVLAEPPRLQDVVGTNRCRLSVAVRRRPPGWSSRRSTTWSRAPPAAAIQWMNRLLGLPETAGSDPARSGLAVRRR